MATPTRYPSGVASTPPGWLLGDLSTLGGPNIYSYFNDFNTYDAADWTVTSSGGGATGTSSLTGGNGGLLLVQSGITENDIQANQLAATSFHFVSGQDVWFAINFEVSDATQSDVIFGLADTFADMTPTDGVYFSKVDGSTSMLYNVTAAGTSTTGTVGTLVAATRYAMGFYYKGSAAVPTLTFYSTIPYAASTVTRPSPYWAGGNLAIAQGSSVAGATFALTNLPSSATGTTMGFGIHAGSAGAKNLIVDYVLAASTVNRY